MTTTANLINSTVSGNYSGATGGGIINDSSPLQLTNATIANNQAATGGGIGIFNTGTTTTLDTIIGSNTATSSAPDFSGTLTSQGNNLIGSTSGAVISGTGTGNILNQSPRLAPLGFYGGATMTHALTSTSPAVNAVSLPSDRPWCRHCGAQPDEVHWWSWNFDRRDDCGLRQVRLEGW